MSVIFLSIYVMGSGGCASGQRSQRDSSIHLGKSLFEIRCAACHELDGTGVAGGGPPLVGSSWVSGPEFRIIRIVLQGVRGPITVNGETYNREMIGFGSVATDDELAALLTYVRRRWGGIEDMVEAASVRKIRTATEGKIGYWTVEELLDIP